MPRSKQEKQLNTFVKGLVTEASPLTFPENASLDEDNFVLSRDGSRSRRLGLDFETGYTLTTHNSSDTSSVSAHTWQVGEDTIGIIHVGRYLYFINLLGDPPSSNLLNGGTPIDLNNFNPIEVTVINKVCVVVQKYYSPFYLTYENGVVTKTDINIYVRDFWGVEDGLDVKERPSTLSAAHQYNLMNQGWTNDVVSTCGDSVSAYQCLKNQKGFYPSNADVWTFGRVEYTNTTHFWKFDPSHLLRNYSDYAYAPKGKYIISYGNRGLSRYAVTGVSGLPADWDTGTPTTVCTYAGRVWYSGIDSIVSGSDKKSPNLGGFVFFSQTVKNNEELGRCYQEADPTSADISDIIATDGGIIHIAEAVNIRKITSNRNSLVVFAENGVWEIYGDEGGFSATSYQLSKVSSVGVDNPASIVVANGTIIYFSKGGIYGLSYEQVSGRLQAENLSITTIQSYYNGLDEDIKNSARGYFDERENKVRWLVGQGELILDLTLGAFYPHSFSSTVEVRDYINIPTYSKDYYSDPVESDGDPVVSDGEVVTVPEYSIANRVSPFAFLVLYDGKFSLAKYQNDSFMDWETIEEENYQSYLVTGYDLFGAMGHKKQVNYLMMFFKKTEDGFTTSGDELTIDHPSSCLVQAQWNWANSNASGKWGRQFQAYRLPRFYAPTGPSDNFDIGEVVITTKSKLRGSGKALSLYITSEEGKDCRLLGWTLDVSTATSL